MLRHPPGEAEKKKKQKKKKESPMIALLSRDTHLLFKPAEGGGRKFFTGTGLFHKCVMRSAGRLSD